MLWSQACFLFLKISFLEYWAPLGGAHFYEKNFRIRSWFAFDRGDKGNRHSPQSYPIYFIVAFTGIGLTSQKSKSHRGWS